jgi:hypothetical protein
MHFAHLSSLARSEVDTPSPCAKDLALDRGIGVVFRALDPYLEDSLALVAVLLGGLTEGGVEGPPDRVEVVSEKSLARSGIDDAEDSYPEDATDDVDELLVLKPSSRLVR